jgi:hypothetical protein|tara:strand:- start:1182 stop:1499 length:318 start_codon:yes stop_codon:yes gene_type:complete
MKHPSKLGDVLAHKYPSRKWVVMKVAGDYVIHQWDEDDPHPTQEQIDAWEIEWEAVEYKKKRKREYPEWETLADALYWKEKGDARLMDTYVADCDAVKVAHPKPE